MAEQATQTESQDKAAKIKAALSDILGQEVDAFAIVAGTLNSEKSTLDMSTSISGPKQIVAVLTNHLFDTVGQDMPGMMLLAAIDTLHRKPSDEAN